MDAIIDLTALPKPSSTDVLRKIKRTSIPNYKKPSRLVSNGTGKSNNRRYNGSDVDDNDSSVDIQSLPDAFEKKLRYLDDDDDNGSDDGNDYTDDINDNDADSDADSGDNGGNNDDADNNDDDADNNDNGGNDDDGSGDNEDDVDDDADNDVNNGSDNVDDNKDNHIDDNKDNHVDDNKDISIAGSKKAMKSTSSKTNKNSTVRADAKAAQHGLSDVKSFDNPLVDIGVITNSISVEHATSLPTEEKKKKGPGRPPKTPKKESKPRNGISKVPFNAIHVVEFMYDTPIIFKKIFNYLKAMAAEQIHIAFKPTEIMMYSIDHTGNARTRIVINAKKLNHYYCKSLINVGICRSDIESNMKKIDKDYRMFYITSEKDSASKHINFILEYDKSNIKEINTMSLLGQYTQLDNELPFESLDYMIKLKLPFKYFSSKMIGNIKASMDGRVSFTQQAENDPLVFSYTNHSRKNKVEIRFENSADFKLESRLPAGEIFNVSFLLKYIKPLASVQFADCVSLFLDESRDLMYSCNLDNDTIQIRTLVKYIDNRPSKVNSTSYV